MTTFTLVEPVVVNDYSKQRDPIMAEAGDVVRYFHQVVHGTEQHDPQSKELSQALALITQHGVEKAKYIIDFAAGKATETNFKVQHFGAVLSYASRAVAEMDRRLKREMPKAAPIVPPLTQPQPERTLWPRGEVRLEALMPEQYRARMEKTRAELLKQIPFLSQQRSDGALHERMVRSRLVRELDHECMDLAPVSVFKLPDGLAKILAQGNVRNSETGL